jgi:hypothetical protein
MQTVNNMNNKYLFKEKQRFNQWWIWLFFFVMIGYSFYSFNKIIDDQEEIITFNVLIKYTMPLLIALIFRFFMLETRIQSDGISVRFFPIHFKRRFYSWEDISECYIRKYRPILEFGGWGLRGFGINKALNVSGNIGLQLVFKDGKKLLIGTKRSEEIIEELTKIGKLTQK